MKKDFNKSKTSKQKEDECMPGWRMAIQCSKPKCTSWVYKLVEQMPILWAVVVEVLPRPWSSPKTFGEAVGGWCTHRTVITHGGFIITTAALVAAGAPPYHQPAPAGIRYSLDTNSTTISSRLVQRSCFRSNQPHPL